MFLKRVKQAFDQHGIDIPYPHLTLLRKVTD
jgi:small-conductance mechanosensitive channel